MNGMIEDVTIDRVTPRRRTGVISATLENVSIDIWPVYVLTLPTL
jgi:hypothetical protein